MEPQDSKMADGSTVGQVLEFVATMRPRVFKLQEISVGYGASGSPGGMTVCYWVGQKRLDDDAYCDIAFRINVSGHDVVAIWPIAFSVRRAVSDQSDDRGRFDRSARSVNRSYRCLLTEVQRLNLAP